METLIAGYGVMEGHWYGPLITNIVLGMGDLGGVIGVGGSNS